MSTEDSVIPVSIPEGIATRSEDNMETSRPPQMRPTVWSNAAEDDYQAHENEVRHLGSQLQPPLLWVYEFNEQMLCVLPTRRRSIGSIPKKRSSYSELSQRESSAKKSYLRPLRQLGRAVRRYKASVYTSLPRNAILHDAVWNRHTQASVHSTLLWCGVHGKSNVLDRVLHFFGGSSAERFY